MLVEQILIFLIGGLCGGAVGYWQAYRDDHNHRGWFQ